MKPAHRYRPNFPEPRENEERGLLASWTNFWFDPTHPLGLHVVRFFSGILFLVWLLPLAGQVSSLWGPTGWLDTQGIAELGALPLESRIPSGWSLLFLATDASSLSAIYWGSIGVLVLYTAGILCRFTAPLTWLVVASFTEHALLRNDADPLLNMLAFYMMLGYLFVDSRNERAPLWQRIVGPIFCWNACRVTTPQGVSYRSSLAARFSLRLLQTHLAWVIVMSALHKLQFGDWWAGTTYWFLLHRPGPNLDITTVRQSILGTKESYMGLLSIGAYLTLAWQLCFPLFAWRSNMRWCLFLGAFIGWLGTVFLYGLPLFGGAMCIMCVSFIASETMQHILSIFADLPGLAGLAQLTIPAQHETAPGTRASDSPLVTTGAR